jgi:molybdopterin converting factor subunit 1
MTVEIKLFAIARERAGCDRLQVELGEPATVQHLRGAISEQCPALADVIPHVRFAVNNEYANDASLIGTNAEIALIPPVSGG